MITCSNCQHKNPDGAIFCAECGAQFNAAEIRTQSIRTDKILESVSQNVRKLDFPHVVSDNAWGSLHLMDSGQILPLTERDEFTLGRISEGQPIMPDLDLSPYQAYASGVSRLHALLKRDGKRVILMDLGSANGTYVNGKRLTANVERLLSHGDVVALGKFKFQVLIK
jgi:hypothetical protein